MMNPSHCVCTVRGFILLKCSRCATELHLNFLAAVSYPVALSIEVDELRV